MMEYLSLNDLGLRGLSVFVRSLIRHAYELGRRSSPTKQRKGRQQTDLKAFIFFPFFHFQSLYFFFYDILDVADFDWFDMQLC
jgi:hypothetical protein